MSRRANIATETKVVRCAVYTRKSTDDGLDKDFTSLDAQRQFAEVFIAEHAKDGWICQPERYDDGGYSGSTLQRPGIQRLLQDARAGLIDCVICYKNDRLSRELYDALWLEKQFFAMGIVVIAVTEQVDSTSPGGRAFKNMMRVMAQLEREQISARCKDKVAAARRAGKYCGGTLVIGYDIHSDGGRLVVNTEEAELVREIFILYLSERSLQSTAAELCRRGVRTKSWTTRDGTFHEGVPFNKNHLSRLLNNPLFIGRVSHKGQTYPGEHLAIIDQELYDRVQAQLTANNVSGGAVTKNRYGHLLRGLLHCTACGTAMSPSVTRRKGRVHRYYVCGNASKKGWKSCPHPSLPAGQIEDAVVERIACIGRDSGLLQETMAQLRTIKATRQPALIAERRRLDRELTRLRDREGGGDQVQVGRLESRLAEIAEELVVLEGQSVDRRDLARALQLFDEVWSCLFPREQERVISLLVERVDFDAVRETVAITFRPTGIRALAEEIAEAQEVAV